MGYPESMAFFRALLTAVILSTMKATMEQQGMAGFASDYLYERRLCVLILSLSYKKIRPGASQIRYAQSDPFCHAGNNISYITKHHCHLRLSHVYYPAYNVYPHLIQLSNRKFKRISWLK